jgi:hypothetical protein
MENLRLMRAEVDSSIMEDTHSNVTQDRILGEYIMVMRANSLSSELAELAS